jgi:hypothetical protein
MSSYDKEEEEGDVLITAYLDCGDQKTMNWQHAHNPHKTDTLGNKWFLCEWCLRMDKNSCPEGRVYHRAVDEKITYQSPSSLRRHFQA